MYENIIKKEMEGFFYSQCSEIEKLFTFAHAKDGKFEMNRAIK